MSTTKTIMTLTKEQAQAIYSAMRTLENVGAKLNARLYERAQLIRVHEAGGFIRVEVGGLQHEVFESQSAFAAAYELLEPSVSHLDALETIASGNTDPDRMVELAKEALAATGDTLNVSMTVLQLADQACAALETILIDHKNGMTAADKQGRGAVADELRAELDKLGV